MNRCCWNCKYSNYTGNVPRCKKHNNEQINHDAYYDGTICDEWKYEYEDDDEQDLNKLQQYKVIEEDLHINLIVFFRCMSIIYEGKKDDCFISVDSKITHGHLIDLHYSKKKVVLQDDDNNFYVYGFDSYNKTWSFNKEELE